MENTNRFDEFDIFALKIARATLEMQIRCSIYDRDSSRLEPARLTLAAMDAAIARKANAR